MSLIVEDGTGKADSEVYSSLVTSAAYADKHGLTFATSGADESPAERASRVGTEWLDATYRDRFPGWPTNGRSQARQWPRTGAEDNSPIPMVIGQYEIPREIIEASIRAAIYEKANPGALSPVVVMAEVSTSDKVGPISSDYRSVTGVSDLRPILTIVDDILAPLLKQARGVTAEILRG